MKFPPGQIVATPQALTVIEEARQDPMFFLNRHLAGDWGEVDDEDKQANDDALRDGDRIRVITEADRSAQLFFYWASTERRFCAIGRGFPREHAIESLLGLVDRQSTG